MKSSPPTPPRPFSAPHGRGTGSNPLGRFERLAVEPDLDEPEALGPAAVPTVYLADASRSVIVANDSPDIPFAAAINPYRGCEHGCVYCYARTFHEYLGFSAGLDFETRILVKADAPELLRSELSAPGWQPKLLALSGVTDAYQPVERKLELTRRCLAVLADFANPVGVITKSALVARDADLLAELARQRAAAVTLSITSLDGELARRMEPRAGHPRERLKAIERLAAAGVPVGVNVAPIVPGLTDHEMPAILTAAAAAGASFAGYTVLRLPGAVAGLFEDWLERHFPDRKEKVLGRVREMRGGQLHDPRFGRRMRGEGVFADQIRALFHHARKRAGLDRGGPELTVENFRRPGGVQLGLFG